MMMMMMMKMMMVMMVNKGRVILEFTMLCLVVWN